jgi:putative ABC transport system ATP-binding protein
MIELKNLRKDYTNENNTSQIVNIFHLRIEDGEKVALMGASGSGKTTFLNLISGLVNADSGEIIVADQSLCSLSEARRDQFRANNIGYLFQSFHLLDGYSALENVELGMLFAEGVVNRQQAIDELSQLGLQDRLNHYPSQLSVGQQARVALARATVNRPRVILADEPTGALDSSNADEVIKLLFDHNERHGSTIVCATHDYELAAKFDRTINVSELR